jgi:hypothetical protein
MFLKYALSIIFLLSFFSCSNKTSLKDEMVLKTLPSSITSSQEISNDLAGYASSIKQIDYDKTLSRFESNAEKDEFKKQMLDLRDDYNKCVDKLKEVEHANEKDKIKKMTELRDLKDELDTVWKYVIKNYRI